MNRSKQESLAFLEFYGLLRQLGRSPQSAYTTALSAYASFANAADAAAALAATPSSAESGMRSAAAIAGAIPMVGGLLSTLIGGYAEILRQVREATADVCSSDCGWPRSEERNRWVGLSTNNLNPQWFSIHDGLVVSGPVPGGPDGLGRVVGVLSWVKTATWRNGWALESPFYAPRVPGGNSSEPWRDSSDTWFKRAWRVREIAVWYKDFWGCESVMCNGAILGAMWNLTYGREGGVVVPGSGANHRRDAVLDEMRRRGSRWYSSLYWLHRDIYELAADRPINDLQAVVEEVRRSQPKVGDFFREFLTVRNNPGSYSARDVPFPWWPATRKLDQGSAMALLSALASSARISGIAAAGTMRVSVQLAPFETCRRAGGTYTDGRCVMPGEGPSPVSRGTGVVVGGVALVGLAAVAYLLLK